MRLRSLAILAAFAVIAAPAHAQYTFITDYYGFSWETTQSGQQWQDGNIWNMTGIIDDMMPPLVFDLSANEYTYYLTGAVQTGPAMLLGSGVDTHNGPYTDWEILYADGATFNVYEDASKNHDWGTNPPNPLYLNTFTDGTLYLGAVTSNLYFLIRQYTNTGNELGSFECDLSFQSGTHLSDIHGPVGGYTFAGVTKRPQASIPVGYKERVDGQQFVTPVEATTWGGIKSLYRR